MPTSHLHSTLPNRTLINEQIASVLIVDDEKALRLVLCRAMEKEGYRAIHASSGERCLALCQEQLPGVILLDAMMPGMDGFQCCKQLKDRFGDRCPPILIITTLCDQESVDKAFAAGATDFITKPIHWAVLRQRVRRLLETCQLNHYWHTCLHREQALKNQLADAMQRLDYLTELCTSKGIDLAL
ncbi:MAG: PleD family two-component system response regulator [Leptolyngbya sp. BL-A-14]